MAGNHRKPTSSNSDGIPFSIEADGQTYSGTLTVFGKAPAFGMPNAFILRMPGKPPMNISIYMGKWVMQGTEEFVKALSEWIKAQYA